MPTPKSEPDVLEVERLAALQFSPVEVDALLRLPAGSVRRSRPAAEAYVRGRLQAEAKARAELLKLVEGGERQAIAQFLELAERTKPQLEGD